MVHQSGKEAVERLWGNSMTKNDIEKWIREIDEAKYIQEEGVVYLKWSRPFTGNSGYMYLCIHDICKNCGVRKHDGYNNRWYTVYPKSNARWIFQVIKGSPLDTIDLNRIQELIYSSKNKQVIDAWNKA